MHALVMYESMFGSTREIAEAVGAGLGTAMDVRVVRAADAGADDLVGVDLVVVGAPTHAHGMPRLSTRRSAPGYATEEGSGLVLEAGADTGPGVREWLAGLEALHVRGAAFDTRIEGPAILTGQASRGIATALHRHGVTVGSRRESFLVDKHGALLTGELERAEAWGASLSTAMSDEAPSSR